MHWLGWQQVPLGASTQLEKKEEEKKKTTDFPFHAWIKQIHADISTSAIQASVQEQLHNPKLTRN